MNSELHLSVKRGKFRMDDPSREHADRGFVQVAGKIRARDKDTCGHCGFKSKKWQEVHHVNDCHSDNRPENLLTVCPLCHSCHHIGFAGIKGSGKLIYLDPSLGLSQADLNNLVRSLWIASVSGSASIKQISIAVLEDLSSRSEEAEIILGCADPMPLSEYLMAMSEDEYASRHEVLKGFYLFPFKSAYEKQLEYWVQANIKSSPASKWSRIAKQRVSKWLKNQGKDDGLVELLEEITDQV